MASAFINRNKANNAGWDRAGVARAQAAQKAAENEQGDGEKHFLTQLENVTGLDFDEDGRVCTRLRILRAMFFGVVSALLLNTVTPSSVCSGADGRYRTRTNTQIGAPKPTPGHGDNKARPSGSMGDLRRRFREKLERGGSPQAINELFMSAEPSTPPSSHRSHDEVRPTLKTTYARLLLRLFTS